MPNIITVFASQECRRSCIFQHCPFDCDGFCGNQRLSSLLQVTFLLITIFFPKVSNKSFAMAYGGFKFFKPMEVMYQVCFSKLSLEFEIHSLFDSMLHTFVQKETSNAVMGALLIHDVVNKAAPSQKHVKGSNPLLLFGTGAFHGGIWRCGWKMNSIGSVHPLILRPVFSCDTIIFVRIVH